MKKQFVGVCAVLVLGGSLALTAGEAPKAKPGSAEMERMKSLVGTWEGKKDMGQGPIDLSVHYRLLAGGNVVEERVFEGTPNEMITLYYDQGGKLALTHYCMLGNRPAMSLKSSDAKTLKFDLDAACGIPTTESHMHALTIRFDDAAISSMFFSPRTDSMMTSIPIVFLRRTAMDACQAA